MDIINWPITTGCENIGGENSGCFSCPSLWEYRDKGWDYSVVCHMEQLDKPFKTNGPTTFTVAFGSDLFHDRVPLSFIHQAFQVMLQCPHHYFEIITKRTERLRKIAQELPWPSNVAMGVTVESAEHKSRIDDLRETPAKIRFISFLPLLGPVGNLDLAGIRCAGVGPEDWGLFRPCEGAWIKEIEDQCNQQGVEIISKIQLYEPQEE